MSCGNNVTVPLFTITGSEIVAMMTKKIETNARAIARLEEELATAEGGDPIVARFAGLIATWQKDSKALSFARSHVDETDIFKVTGAQLDVIQGDLEPIAYENLPAEIALEMKASQEMEKAMAIGPAIGRQYSRTAGLDCEPRHWRRW